MDAWTDFSTVAAGASAALIGLLVVALSINLRQVVGSDRLPARAVLALLLLVVPLFAALLQLVPQSATAFGIELLALGTVFGTWLAVLARPGARDPAQPFATWVADTVVPAAVVTGATLVTGGLLVAGTSAGFYGLPVLVLGGFAGALVGTWVLLVEILR